MEFLALLSAHAYSLPYYIIWLAGIVYAVVNRRRHPRTSWFAALALGILLVEGLISALGSTYIQYHAFASDLRPVEYGIQLAMLSVCTLPLSILGWILLLVAMFRRENVLEREAIINHAD
jgi:hypothetical protein